MTHRALIPSVLILAAVTLAGAARVVDEVVIKVNDAIITKSEYEGRLKSTIAGMQREYKGPDLEARLKEVPQQLLDQMEDELLLIEKAKQLYQVDLIVDSQVERFMKDNKMKTKADLAKALEPEGMTVDAFRKQVLLIYVPEFMKSREIRSSISVSTREIEGYFEAHKDQLATKPRVQLQEILLLKTTYTKEQAEAIAAEVERQLKSGADFGSLAEKYSQAFSRTKKGEAGWFGRQDLDVKIADNVFALSKGQTSGLIPTSGGWYIFRLEDAKGGEAPSLEKARGAIVETLKEQKFNKAYKAYIAQLKKQNYVWVNPKYV